MKKNSFIFLALLLMLGVFISYPQKTFAATSSVKIDGTVIKYEAINPDSPLYPIKRLFEKIKLEYILKGNKSEQAKYMSVLLDSRFKEFVYVIENKKLGVFEQSSSRFTSTIGSIILDYSNLDPNLSDQSKKYSRILIHEESLYGDAGSSYWRLIQQAVDTANRIN